MMDDQVAMLVRIAVALCALVPFIVFLKSYLRTRATRLLLAALGFGVFFVKQVLLAAGIFTFVVNPNPHVPTVTHSQLELLEGAFDLTIVLLFLAALLWRQGAAIEQEAGTGDKKESV